MFITNRIKHDVYRLRALRRINSTRIYFSVRSARARGLGSWNSIAKPEIVQIEFYARTRPVEFRRILLSHNTTPIMTTYAYYRARPVQVFTGARATRMNPFSLISAVLQYLQHETYLHHCVVLQRCYWNPKW